MTNSSFDEAQRDLIAALQQRRLSAFDLLPHQSMQEKLVDLVLNDVPPGVDKDSSRLLTELRRKLRESRVDDIRVVVFGGGTGLSNIIGGDSRQKSWPMRPFDGLKRLFPQTRAVVCVTDDGGSTGELLKDLPVFGLGDIRHVLLSSIQIKLLQQQYDLSPSQSLKLVHDLSRLFNFRFNQTPGSAQALLENCGLDLHKLPPAIADYIGKAIDFLFSDEPCRKALGRPQCLGNLLILFAIRRVTGDADINNENAEITAEQAEAIYDSLSACAELFGAASDSVMPCTVVPAQLRFRYSDGVQVTGEAKSSEAQRGTAVDRVQVDFCGVPYLSERIKRSIEEADIIIMAPGSLYSSIIPVMQVPGIAEAVRANTGALKLLISNLWVQEGETDKSINDLDRKFLVSDMLRAYQRNLPGGVDGLFTQVLCIAMHNVPASVIQNYAVEGKVPIYVDRTLITSQGFEPIECGFFSKSAMLERGVIQHDPGVVARTVKTLYLSRSMTSQGLGRRSSRSVLGEAGGISKRARLITIPAFKYRVIAKRLHEITLDFNLCDSDTFKTSELRDQLIDILWTHQDIPVAHLDLIDGITCISQQEWRRDQRWDNVFSFYDPADRLIKIREDRFGSRKMLEVAILIAIGQALLGDYASQKVIKPLNCSGVNIGSVYHLYLKDSATRSCYFSDRELRDFLILARMVEQSPVHFTRAVNGQEGFTPPGLLMGLLYAWYLDNRFAGHIEYKMSILRVQPTGLIPEQKKMRSRREQLIDFFRESVFGKDIRLLDDGTRPET